MGRLIILLFIAIITGFYVQCAAPAELKGKVTELSINKAIMGLEKEKNNKVRLLYIDTAGGEVDAGLTLFRYLIKPENHNVKCIALQAQSMGFFILQACATRAATADAILMTHNIRASFTGATLKDLKLIVKELDEIESILYPFIAKRIGLKTREDLEKLHESAGGDFTVTGKVALELGMIDHIIVIDSKPSTKKK